MNLFAPVEPQVVRQPRTFEDCGRALGNDGRDYRQLDRIIALGLLEEAPSQGRRRMVYWDGTQDRLSLYEDYVATLPAVLDLDGLDHLRSVRKTLAIPAAHPYPLCALEGAFQQLDRIQNFSIDEAAGLISIPEDGYAPFRRYFDERRGVRLLPYTQGKVGDVRAVVRAFLPPQLHYLPRTGLAKTGNHRFALPPNNYVDRFRRLTVLAPMALAFAAMKAPASPSGSAFPIAIAVFDRIDRLLANAGSSPSFSSAAFTDLLRRYLRGEIGIDVLDLRCPFEIVSAYLTIERFLARAGKVYNASLRGSLSSVLLPPTQFSGEEKRAIAEKIRQKATEGRANRKSDAQAVFGVLSELVEIAENRRAQISQIGNCLRDVIADMTPKERYRDVVVRLDPLDDHGFQTFRHIALEFRVWRPGALAKSVAKDLDALDQVKRRRHDYFRAFRGAEKRLQKSTGPIVELRSGLSDDLPLFIRMLVGRVSSFPSTLPLTVRKQRLDLIETYGLPGFQPARAGFLKFSRDCETLGKYALIVGRQVLPIFELERALRYAALLFRMSVETQRRLHELMQLDCVRLVRTEDGRHFSHHVEGKRSRFAKSAKEKSLKLEISDEATVEGMDLDDLQKAHFGWDAMPLVRPGEGLDHKVPCGHYCFSFGGKMMTRASLILFLRYLFAGWPSVTTHLVRHAIAEEAREDEVPVGVVGAGLGQESESVTEYYMGIDRQSAQQMNPSDISRRLENIEMRSRDLHGLDPGDG